MFKTKKEVKSWLDEYGVKGYTINKDLSVDVKANIKLTDKKLNYLPVQFNMVAGDFFCNDNMLTDMVGFPKAIWGDINCWNNQISSFKGCPKYIKGSFYCHENFLTSLEFCLEKVDKTFCCAENQLTSLEFGPKYVGADYVAQDNKITSFEFAPLEVGGNMDFYYNPLERVDNLKTIFSGNFRHYNKIDKIKGLEYFYDKNNTLELSYKSIKSILLSGKLNHSLNVVKSSKLNIKI